MQDTSKDGLILAFDMDTKNDLCDLPATPSLGNKKYFVTFIDDASRFCYVYLLHTKDETLDKFKAFKTKVELQQGSLIKRFRTDRGRLSQGFWGEAMLTACYLLNRVPNKRNKITLYELWTKRKPNLNYLRVWGCRAVVRLPDQKLKTLGERRIECIFVGYAEHSKAFMVPEEVTEEVVAQQPEPELRKSKRNRTPKNFGPEFQLYLIEGTRDEVYDQHSYCFNVEDDPKTFDEVMKSQDIIHRMDVKISFLNGELDEEQAPKKWHQKFDEVVLSNGYLLNQADKYVYRKFNETGKGVIICLYVDDMLIFGTDQVQVELTNKLLSSRFSMKDMGEANVILVSTPMDTSEKLMPNNGQTVSQLEYYRVSGCLIYAMTCTRLDIAFVVGKLSRYTSNPRIKHWQEIQRVLKYLKKTIDYSMTYTGYPSVLEGYTDASWITNTEDNSSTSGCVFLLGRGAISWASKKQTCITSLTIEYEFIALAAAGKVAKWLRNLILEIPLWSKPIAPISILCDSGATLANAYSQIYNRKSRHLGVRHNMLRELIMNEVVSIEFVRSQQNLADHLTKGLARDLVINYAEGMGLKSN
ncbi:zinc finger, CCHC-type containing protein [Tanacetum coccineum]|uniref:Zinc finger, CCHC-type containing protein n=1 Tax=Tanacetum coccineum TaxID=301880 RepID=A0ABQ4XPA9_9ASTR